MCSSYVFPLLSLKSIYKSHGMWSISDTVRYMQISLQCLLVNARPHPPRLVYIASLKSQRGVIHAFRSQTTIVHASSQDWVRWVRDTTCQCYNLLFVYLSFWDWKKSIISSPKYILNYRTIFITYFLELIIKEYGNFEGRFQLTIFNLKKL